MGAFSRSAAASVLATAAILCVTAGAETAGRTVRVDAAPGQQPPEMHCPDSMVWDGHICVQLP
jgi:hypothetical protein